MNMREEHVHCTVQDKNKFNDRKKSSIVFDRAMSNVYENNVFPTTSL